MSTPSVHPYFLPTPYRGVGRPAKSVFERFWPQVDTSGECWIWIGGLDDKGYGTIKVGSSLDGTRKTELAHRVSWVIHFGKIPNGLFVLHNCPGGDNSACVNPSHLWLGNQQENIRDRDRKGRGPLGERNPRAKLSEAQVIEIRLRYATGLVSQRALGREYGVTKTMIRDIVTGRNWKHLLLQNVGPQG